MAARGLFDVEVVEQDAVQDPHVVRLMAQAAHVASLGFTPSYGPGDHGNFSCRTTTGLIITARETVKVTLRPEHFVEVVGVDDTKTPALVHCRGQRLPSTDTLLHWRIYHARPEIGAILHGHDPLTLAHAAALQLPMTTQSALTQTLELVEETVRLTTLHDYVLLRDHGFLALGTSIEEAGQLIDAWAQRARTLSVGA